MNIYLALECMSLPAEGHSEQKAVIAIFPLQSKPGTKPSLFSCKINDQMCWRPDEEFKKRAQSSVIHPVSNHFRSITVINKATGGRS